ncbi:MAG: translation initiation factor IF-2 [Muribaculaceae bacterium]|nr:translation initiation factor IF-2 [Muribaculaceae bacterium]
MRTKISKIANDLNVGVNTVVEFLRKHNIEVDSNPNARIDEDAVELLRKEFSHDKAVKAKVEGKLNERRSDRTEKTERRQQQTVEIPQQQPQLKVVGKINLEEAKRPKPVAEPEKKDKATATVKKEDKPQEPVKAPQKPVETPKVVGDEKKPQTVQPKAESGVRPQDEPKEQKRVEKPEEKKETPAQQSEETKPAPAPKKDQEVVKPVEKADVEQPSANKEREQKPQSSKEPKGNHPAGEEKSRQHENGGNMRKAEHESSRDDDEDVFRLNTPEAPKELKVLGKIDLSSLNQTTRPKKKGHGGRSEGEGGNDRKKRRRIGKEKVDIEKAAAQAGLQGDGKKKDDRRDQNDRKRGDRKEGHKGKKNERQRQDDYYQEDVQKQVKETLARLTTKAPKKSLKWRKEKKEAIHNREMENQRREEEESKIIKLTEFVTANDLANLMEVPVNNVIATCMNLGVMVSINQRLDAETINIVADEFGYSTEYVSAEVSEAIAPEEDKEEDLQSRPPIVTVMGHVDHGKTSLLDYIRKANVIAGEAGGITQHIGAYNVKLPDGRRITFLDTPGHEAFTAMRARGAKVTDIAIIIVAADDDVMPQTIEAINHASAAGVPMVFAINKIDKPTANPDKIKEQLSAMNYLVEDWGGKYQSQDISAKKGMGVEELMEKVLLEAEMLELKANPDRLAIGSVIESSLDKGRGYVATVLVQNGTLKVGDVILAGTHYGKIKAMFNERNQRVKEAGPATPVMILGMNGAPTAGDTFNVLETEQEAREIATKREQLQRELGLRTKKRLGLEELGRRRALNDFHELNLVVKGDVDGSVEAISDALIKLSTPEIQVNVLHKGVGAISESDVTLAAASDAIIIGFQVRPSAAARREAEKEGVEIRLYSVIYKAIEEVKDAMEGLLSPEIKEEITGTAEVLQTYHISKVGTIAGAIVRDGRIKRSNKVRVIRDGIVIYTGELGSLKRFKDDVKEVVSGYDCGLSVQGYNDIKEGDLIEGFEEVEVKRGL